MTNRHSRGKATPSSLGGEGEAERKRKRRVMIGTLVMAFISALLMSLVFYPGDAFHSSNLLFIDAANDYFREGNARFLERDFQSAASAYQETIRIYPEHGFAWANLALALHSMDTSKSSRNDHDSLNFDATLTAYEQAISLLPHRARTHYNLGLALTKISSWEEATLWFRMAVKQSPRFTSAMLRLATCYQETGKTKLALETFQRILHMEPFHVAARLKYCYLLMVQQNEPGAEDCYANVLDIEPRNVEALVQLARMAHRRYELNRARKIFAGVLSMDYYNSVALFSQAVLQRRNVSQTLLHKYVTDSFNLMAFHYDRTLTEQERLIPHELLKGSMAWLVGKDASFQRCLQSSSIGDAKAASLEISNDMEREAFDPSYKECLKLFDFHDKMVLDVGCGTGLLCEEYRQMPSTPLPLQFYGVDISEAMVGKALARDCYNGAIQYEAEDFMSSVANDMYDLILASESFKFIGSLDRIFQSSLKLLNAGGILSFSVDVYQSPVPAEDSADEPPEAADTLPTRHERVPPLERDEEGQPPLPAGKPTRHVSSIHDVHSHIEEEAAFFLHPLTGCFVHAFDYVLRLAAESGLEVLHYQAMDSPLTRNTGEELESSHSVQTFLFTLQARTD